MHSELPSSLVQVSAFPMVKVPVVAPVLVKSISVPEVVPEKLSLEAAPKAAQRKCRALSKVPRGCRFTGRLSPCLLQ